MHERIEQLRSRLVSRLGDYFDMVRRRRHSFMVVCAVIIGVGGGFAAILFRYLIELATYGFSGGETKEPSGFAALPWFWILLMPAAGGLVVGILSRYLAPEVRGTGIPDVMEAVALRGAHIRKRVALVKAAAVAACVGSGGSAGREGPIVHVGASVGSLIGQTLNVPVSQLRTFVGCGAAAGIAATFNAPIAGAMFAGEVILGQFGVVSFSAIVISSVVATVLSRHFIGDFPAFVVPIFKMQHTYELVFFAGLGLCAAILGCIFIWMLGRLGDTFDKLPTSDLLKPVLGGLMVGGLGIFVPEVLGVGYAGINDAMHSSLPLATMAALLGGKLLATSLTLSSGGSGGIFAPSLFLGAMLGGLVGAALAYFMPGEVGSGGSYALVAMGAMVAATTRASITAIIIIFEMTNNYTIILPLMIACILAMLVAGQIVEPSIYLAKLLRRGVDLSIQNDINILRRVKVEAVELAVSEPVHQNTPLIEILDLALDRGWPHYTVVDKDDHYVGLIHLSELRHLFFEKEDLAGLIVADDLVHCDLPTLDAKDDLDLALKLMSKTRLNALAVVDSEHHTGLLGVLTRGAIIERYNRELLDRDFAGETATLMLTAERARTVDLGHGTVMVEAEVPRSFVGKRLADLELRNRFGAQIVLVRSAADGEKCIPGPDLELNKGDTMLLLGPVDGINKIIDMAP